MKFLMLMWLKDEAYDGTEEDYKAWTDFEAEAKAASVFVMGSDLQQAQKSSKLVIPQLAKPEPGDEITEGTYTDGDMQVGAFYIMDCKDEADALAWASKLPTRGTVEVRPFQEYDYS